MAVVRCSACLIEVPMALSKLMHFCDACDVPMCASCTFQHTADHKIESLDNAVTAMLTKCQLSVSELRKMTSKLDVAEQDALRSLHTLEHVVTALKSQTEGVSEAAHRLKQLTAQRMEQGDAILKAFVVNTQTGRQVRAVVDASSSIGQEGVPLIEKLAAHASQTTRLASEVVNKLDFFQPSP